MFLGSNTIVHYIMLIETSGRVAQVGNVNICEDLAMTAVCVAAAR
jgi:hypothetical protein